MYNPQLNSGKKYNLGALKSNQPRDVRSGPSPPGGLNNFRLTRDGEISKKEGEIFTKSGIINVPKIISYFFELIDLICPT